MKNIQIFDTKEALFQAAASIVVQTGTEAIQLRGRFSITLSGGSTPLPLYQKLTGDKWSGSLDWDKTHFFWGDERAVNPDHPDSNYRGAFQSLLSLLRIPPQNIHRIKGEYQPDRAAAEYEKNLLTWFGNDPPRFDLILLGMGDDGHTASLFPGTTLVKNAGDSQHQWVDSVFVPQLDSWRISMTPRLINTAALVVFLVLGRNKAGALREVLQGSQQPEVYPSQLIQPKNGQLVWLVDREAAAELES